MQNVFLIESAINVVISTVIGGATSLLYNCSPLLTPIFGVQAVVRGIFVNLLASYFSGKDLSLYKFRLIEASIEPIFCVAAVATCLALGILTPPLLGAVIGLSVGKIVEKIIAANKASNTHPVYI